MSGIRSLLLSFCLGMGHAAQLHGQDTAQSTDSIIRKEACKPSCLPNCPQASRTGVPCLPKADKWPYKTNRPWSKALGERILKAATPGPDVTDDVCQGFQLFGDSAWCLVAFKNEPKDVIGLSFGIEQRDLWSETMSNTYHMPTKLYDCFQRPDDSPVLAMTVPNAKGSCVGASAHCYETHYEAFQTCLGAKKQTLEGRDYGTLSELLAGRNSQSTHVKIDVEGSEWAVLADLLKNEDDMRKIRTLDMEVHFGFGAASEKSTQEGLSTEDRVAREVKIFEELAKTFAVTGSNIETNAGGWQVATQCAKQDCEQPMVHTKGAFPVNQFAISFINRDFLRQSEKPEKQIMTVTASGKAEEVEDRG